MNVSEIFIRRPIATALLSLAMLLLGMVAYRSLPVAPLPRVDLPTIQVRASLPGASPETMASAVATPLERRFGRIAGISEMTSNSSLGSTSITLQFEMGRDADAVARDVQAAINAAGGELPAEMPARPSYRKVNPADAPILILSARSRSLPLSAVFDIANTVIAQKIAQVDGVGQVTVDGGQQPAVRIRADPGALAGVGLTLEDIRSAVRLATVNQPKGSVSTAAQARVITGNDQLFDAAGYRDIIVAHRGGAAVRLGDVATVIDDVEDNRVAAWHDGARAVVLIVRRQPGANILETIDRVSALLPTLSRSISPAIELSVGHDRAQTIRASIHDIELTLLLSVALVVLVVFAFLRDARATIIPSVAVPLSLTATFGVMYWLGYSLDNLSLMALAISTGFVVDDAIVVTENVSRFVEEGAPPLSAALAGAKQIGFTIVSITASLLAAFIPILFAGGIVGRLFREFAVTLSVAVFVSALVSLTLTPMMCARLLRRGEGARAHPLSERLFERMTRGYAHGLCWVLDHRRFMAGVTAAALALSAVLFVSIPKGLFPQQDTGFLLGISEAPQDTSFAAMRDKQEAVNAVLSEDPAIKSTISFVEGGSAARAFIELRRSGERPAADEIIARLRPKLARIPGVAVYLQSVQDVRTGARVSRSQYQYTLQDADVTELRAWAPRVAEALARLPQLKDVSSDLQVAGLQAEVIIDRDTAGRLGVRPRDIDEVLYDAFGQRQIATYYTPTNQYRVILEVPPELSASPESIQRLHVSSPGGGPVPLPVLTRISSSVTAASLLHQGQFPAVTLSFNLAPGVALSQAIDAIHAAEQGLALPSGLHGSFQGTAQQYTASLATMPLLLVAALLAVYIVLGVLYESFIHPITILSTLPSAGLGALTALLLCRTELSLIAFIGIILLMGIVMKNAIMMIDFAVEAEREEGLSPREAITKACLLRLRPILMTTMAALLGSVPLAVGTGTGSELRRPLGIAIVGGLIVSQALTLFTTPVTYLLLDRLSRRKRPTPGGAQDP